MVIVNTDPYAFHPQWQPLSEKNKTNPDGVAYVRIKYQEAPQYSHGYLWRLSRLIAALALYVIPCFTSKKKISKFFQAARSGLDIQVVRVARRQNLLLNIPLNLQDILGTHNTQVEQAQTPRRKHVDLHMAKAEGLIDSNNLQMLEISEEEVYQLQGNMQVTNPKYDMLDLKKLDKTQLPTFRFQLGEVTYYCSKLFKIGNNSGVLALVKMGDKVYPRLFYRSNSQGYWRVLPAIAKAHYHYHAIIKDQGLGHFWKGLFESDTQLPIALNLALQDLMRHPPVEMYDKASDVVKTENFNETYVERVMADKFGWMPVGAPEGFYKAGFINPIPPDPTKIKMPDNRDLHPDFSVELASKEFEDPSYGKLIAHIYASKDKSLQYCFYEAEDGKVFLAGVERVIDNPINPYGIRHKAVETKGMAAPLLEYYQQIPQAYEADHNAHCYKSDRYKNNWNYVRDLEVIQLYYAGRKLPLPAKLPSYALS